MQQCMVFLSMKRWTEKYISNDKLHRENDRALYRFWSTSETWRPRTAPNHFTPFSLFNSHFESPPSTIFHGKQYRFRYLPNNSKSFSSVSSYERGEENREEKKKGGREGREGKKVKEKWKKKREREKKKAKEKYTRRGGRKKRGRYLHSRDLKYPEAFRIRYLTLSSSLSPLPSPLPLPPSSRAASLSVGLECTAVTRLHRD